MSIPDPDASGTGGHGVLVETLLGVAASLSSPGNFDDLLANILMGARTVMRCAACSISLPDEQTGDLLIHSTQRDWQKEGPWRLPTGQGIAGKVYETRIPVNTKDAAQHPEHYKRTGTDTGMAAHALLTIPLMDGEECRGVMQGMNPEGRSSFDEDDVKIFAAFGSLVSVTLGRRQAEERAREHAVLEAERKVEMELARQVQTTFLPEPNIEHGTLRLEAFLEQATGIGGDFYFFHKVQAHLLLTGVGDITGKGSSAALDMARLTTQIALAAPTCSAEGFAAWLVQLNNVLYEAMHAGDNAAAMVVVLLDLDRRVVHAATFAQHAPLYRSREDHSWKEAACPRNGFVAQRKLTQCQVARFPLAAGSHWLLHSDGITEAGTLDGGQFGREGLRALLQKATMARKLSVAELVSAWNAKLDNSARDDATLLLLEDRTPPPPREFATLCTPASIRDARGFFEQWAKFAGFPQSEVVKLLVGCDEILTNIIKYAYGLEEPPGPLFCLAEVTMDKLRFIIKHQGVGLTQEQAAIQNDARNRDEGGLGLALVRRVFTHVQFFAGDAEQGSEIVLEKALF